MNGSQTSELERAAAALARADAVLIGAGAGMGVDSGLPDFRGPEGFWRAYPAVAKLGLSFAEMANPLWFRTDPSLAWAFYGHRQNLYRSTVPHAGFQRLLEIARAKPAGYFVFTSNVDGQFQKAGYDEARIDECHGSIHFHQCVERCDETIWPAVGAAVEIDEATFRARDPLPVCPRCGAMARPNILMFGDGEWIDARSAVQAETCERWLDEIYRQKARLVAVEIGAGTAIPSVRFALERAARESGGTLIRINPRDADVTDGHIGLKSGALEGIQLLAARMEAGKRE